MNCGGCGSDSATRTRTVYQGDKMNWTKTEVCDLCSRVRPISTPDVYFKEPYFDTALGDKKNPHGQMVFSKGHKAQLLKQQNLREAGDRVRGSRSFDQSLYNRHRDILRGRT